TGGYGQRTEGNLRPRGKRAGHAPPGQSGSAHVAGHRSLEELGSWPLALHLAGARRLQEPRRQGSVHSRAALLRDKVGKEAVTRPSFLLRWIFGSNREISCRKLRGGIALHSMARLLMVASIHGFPS